MDAQTDGWLKATLNNERGVIWIRRDAIDGVQVTPTGVGLHTRGGALHSVTDEFEGVLRDMGIVAE